MLKKSENNKKNYFLVKKITSIIIFFPCGFYFDLHLFKQILELK